MLDKIQNALNYFNQGCSCSQSIVMSYGPEFGLESDMGLKIASAFGGGMARRGEICGVVSGALMILGLTMDIKPGNPKEQAYIASQDFIKRFQQRNGNVGCKELLGVDIGTPEGKQLANQRDLHKKLCSKFVRDAAEILEEYIVDK